MNKRQTITSKFIGLKAMAILFFVTMTYLTANRFLESSQVDLFGLLFFCGVPIIIFSIATTRNKVDYDGEVFYISNWKGVEIAVVPNEKVSSMLHGGFQLSLFYYSYRLFYDAGDGKKKEFWIHPNGKVSIEKIKRNIKSANPDLFISNSAMKGLEHLIFRSEKWFR